MFGDWWKRLRRLAAGGVRQRVTRSGLVFTLMVVMVGIAAFVSANNLLFLLFAVMLAALMVSGLASRLTLAELELDVSLPEHIAARQKAAAQVRVHNRKWFAAFSVRLSGVRPSPIPADLYFPILPPRRAVQVTVEAEFPRRGRYRENAFEFSTRFPFGFTERRIRVTLKRDILVYPSLEPQPGFAELLHAVAGEIETHLRGRGSDFYRIRPYEPLESARHVDWKATAHTGELQVREFARDQDPLADIVLDLPSGVGREAWFERAVECCAFLLWHISQRDARVRFRTQHYELSIPAEGDVYHVLRHLAVVAPVAGTAVPEPPQEPACTVVFTAREKRFEEEGWLGAFFVTPESFAAATDPARREPHGVSQASGMRAKTMRP